MLMGIHESGFRYTQGVPATFTRDDLESPSTREFCGNCGTHILTRSPRLPRGLILKVGTLDDPSLYEGPDAAIWVSEKQPYHVLPDGIAQFETTPG
jgi:hypothetical protein